MTRTPKKKTSTPKPSDPQSGAMKDTIRARRVVPKGDTRVIGSAIALGALSGISIGMLCEACKEPLRPEGREADGAMVVGCGCAFWVWGV